MNDLLVLHAVPDSRRCAGGIASALPPLCAALREEGVDSQILASAMDEGDAPAACAKLLMERRSWRLPAQIRREVACRRAEAARSGRGLVLHSHGLWSWFNHALSAAAQSERAPLVISPHGMLLPWARRHKAFRKTVAWRLYQARDLAGAGAVHVTSEAERDAAREAGVACSLAVIPFGVELAPANREAALRSGSPGAERNLRTFLFLGRVHPVKNLATLVDAFADASPKDSRLRIVGPDEVGHRSELERLAALRKIADRASFEDATFGEAKRRLFEESDVLILPSHSENYGAVVAEALAHGVPAIASTGTPWRVLEQERCGWWIGPDRQSLAEALREAASRDFGELRAMGSRGRAYVEAKLTWRSCARQMASLYRRLHWDGVR